MKLLDRHLLSFSAVRWRTTQQFRQQHFVNILCAARGRIFGHRGVANRTSEPPPDPLSIDCGASRRV